ncbi:hypothetical protein DFH28DRAFT_942339 [Melampsora americana]|nr:hypothetical protein DFH28DRAFT_942339 [Melampsora americana]
MRLTSFPVIFCFWTLALPSRLSGPLGQVDAKPSLRSILESLSLTRTSSGQHLPIVHVDESKTLIDRSSVESVTDKDWLTYYNLIDSQYLRNHRSLELGMRRSDDVLITHRILETARLKDNHRLWALGVLLCLKRRSTTQEDSSPLIMKDWKIFHLDNRRVGDFELFLLKDHNLCRILSRQEVSDNVIKEALDRAKNKDLINKTRHREFQKLLVSFMNLKTPIDDTRANVLMEKIKKILHNTKRFLGTPSEKFAIRILLHMEEYHFNSMIQFRELITNPKICTLILTKDVEFQLEDTDLSPILKKVLKSLMNNETLKSESIHMALEAMADEKYSLLHRARVTRVLNLMTKHDDDVYNLINAELNHSHSMISSLSNMFSELSHGNMHPEGLRKNDIQALVLQKECVMLTDARLSKLELDLLSEEFLYMNDIEYLFEEFRLISTGSSATGLIPLIKKLLVKLMRYRSDSTDPKLYESKCNAIEFISHLILLIKYDIRLYRNLLIKGSSFIQDISSEFFSVAGDDSRSLDDRLKILSKHLTTALSNSLEPTGQTHSACTPTSRKTYT